MRILILIIFLTGCQSIDCDKYKTGSMIDSSIYKTCIGEIDEERN